MTDSNGIPGLQINRRVLIVDDNQTVLDAFRMILGGSHDDDDDLQSIADEVLGASSRTVEDDAPSFDLTCCTQGQEAAELARERNREGVPFSLAFVDVRMPPGWDGITTIEHLWQHDPRLQVVICSAYSDYSWQEITARLSRSDNLLILKKPFDTIEVQQLAESLAHKWSLTQANEIRLHEVRQAQIQLRSVMDNSLALIWQKDLDGRYLMVNNAFCARVGLSEEEILGHTDYDLFRDHARALVERDELALTKGLTETEEQDPRCGEAWFLTVRFALPDEAGNPTAICAMANDITTRRKLEQQLRQGHKMEAIGRLAGGIAHDFNNLLTAILGFANLAAEQTDKTAPTYAPLAEVIKASNQASELTRQLLAYSRQQVLTPVACDLNDVIRDLATMLERLINRGHRLVANLTHEELPVRLDAAQIGQVIVNLVVNARDAMPDGGDIELRTSSTEGSCVIEVIDHGTGMDAATVERIFDPFFTTKQTGEGTGLGLATVQGIIQQSGGSIDLETTPGAGTTFLISFPRQVEVHAGSSAKRQAVDPTPTILVVDDVLPVRDLATESLRRCGYHVLAAADPTEALKVLEEYGQPIDLLLTDIVMPIMSGLELADQISGSQTDLLVLYMSGYANSAREDIAAANYMQKPFTINEMIRRVNILLGDRALSPG